MIDNFEHIKKLFYFNEADNMFFHCIISKKVKNQNFERIVIKNYLIKSKEELDELKDEIIFVCNKYNADAYINICGKSFLDVNKYLLAQLATYNFSYELASINPINLLNSCASQVSSNKSFIAIDINDDLEKENIENYICEIFARDKGKSLSEIKKLKFNYIIADIPIKNGSQLITKPFDYIELKNKFKNISINYNSYCNVLLYSN